MRSPPAAIPRIAVFLNVADQPAREMIGGIGDYAREAGPWRFTSVLRRADWPRGDLARLPVDAVLAQLSLPDQRRRVLAMNRPVVNLANTADVRPVPSVTNDDTAVGTLARGHFDERGFHHRAFCGPEEFRFSRERFDGFRRGETCPAFWLPEPYSMDGLGPATHRRFASWLSTLPKPVAVFAATDRYARLVIECCEHVHLAVPDDVAVLGVNNDPVDCELTDIPVSSIHLDARRQGREAAQRVHALMRGRSVREPILRIPPQGVITRLSTDVLAVPDRAVVTALRQLRSHLHESVDIADLARTAGVSRRSLELRFRRHLGRSPYEELIRLRVNRAREQLRVRGLRISEVAERCGFAELRFLDLHFRRATGQTPSAYRRSLGPG